MQQGVFPCPLAFIFSSVVIFSSSFSSPSVCRHGLASWKNVYYIIRVYTAQWLHTLRSWGCAVFCSARLLTTTYSILAEGHLPGSCTRGAFQEHNQWNTYSQCQGAWKANRALAGAGLKCFRLGLCNHDKLDSGCFRIPPLLPPTHQCLLCVCVFVCMPDVNDKWLHQVSE